MTKIKEKEISLIDCLSKLEKKEISNLYGKLAKELKSNKKNITTEEKLECIATNIAMSYPIISFTLTDEETKQLNDIIKGKKISNISSKLINNNFIFKENDNYIIPEEIKEMTLFVQNKNQQKEKHLFVFSYYMEVNGVLEVKKLIELIKATGFNLTKKQIIEYATYKEFIVEGNLIYFNELAKHLDDVMDIHNLKKENKYKEFTIEEMLGLQIELAEENYVEQISKILSKKVKNKQNLNAYSNAIYNMVSVGYDYQDDINQLLEIEKINLSEKDKLKLETLVDEMFWFYPSWELNGYSEVELSEYSEDEDIPFDDLSPKEQTDAYINMYLSINGAMETDKLFEIITTNHNINITRREFLKIASESEDFTILDDHICFEGTEDLIPEIMPIKNMLKEYKIIEDIDQLLEEQLEITDKTVELGIKYGLDEDLVSGIEQIMRMGGISEEIIISILKEDGYKLSTKKQKELVKELLDIQKDVRIWGLNGFKKSELTNLNKSEKIGRNEPCPCNSGKKYKQCCGK